MVEARVAAIRVAGEVLASAPISLRLAESGREVHLELRLSGGAVAARFICFPPLEHEDGPMMINTPPTRFRAVDTAV